MAYYGSDAPELLDYIDKKYRDQGLTVQETLDTVGKNNKTKLPTDIQTRMTLKSFGVTGLQAEQFYMTYEELNSEAKMQQAFLGMEKERAIKGEQVDKLREFLSHFLNWVRSKISGV
jgi:hypothetical protein